MWVSEAQAKKHFYYYLQNGFVFENAPKQPNTSKVDLGALPIQELLRQAIKNKKLAAALKKNLASNLATRLQINMESASKFYEQDIKAINLKTKEGYFYLLEVAKDYVETFNCKK